MTQEDLLSAPAAKATSPDIVRDVENFACFGRETQKTSANGIPYYINEYWTSKQRKAHSLHEISYRACFKAQLPEFFIERLTSPGDTVHDPFMGRGTTPVQAALMRRNASGNDINPLSTLITRPRLRPASFQDVSAALRSIDYSAGRVKRDDLLAFYHPETLRKLEALREWLIERAPSEDPSPDPAADWIRMVAINKLSGHSTNFFSGRSMPPNQAVSVRSQLRINERLGASPPEKDIPAIIERKTRALTQDGPMPDGARFSLHTGMAWETPRVKSRSISLVVTSPPFLDIVNYASDNWLRCWFAGINPDDVKISMHRGKEGWAEMVHNVLREQARILKPGGHVAFEVGEVRNKKVLLEELVWEAAAGLPFERLAVMVNEQRFTKTSNCWGVKNGAKGTNTNRIVLLQRH